MLQHPRTAVQAAAILWWAGAGSTRALQSRGDSQPELDHQIAGNCCVCQPPLVVLMTLGSANSSPLLVQPPSMTCPFRARQLPRGGNVMPGKSRRRATSR